MRITYYALKDLQVGEDLRHPGDLVPEARDWPVLHGYINQGLVAPVLVASLPQHNQDALRQWEQDQEPTTDVVEPVPTPTEATADPTTAPKPTTTKQKVRG